MPHLVNLPPFMYKAQEVEKFNIIQKMIFVAKGKITSFVINNTNKKIFCFFMNLLFNRNGVIKFDLNKYYSFNTVDKKIFFPNKRVVRFINNFPNQLNIFYDSYCLNKIKFSKEDIIFDCGANIGELYVALQEKNHLIRYVGFEPDHETFECLKLNVDDKKSILYNFALHEETGHQKFYLDNYGGNSSLVDFGSQEYINVECKSLDDLEVQDKIKLFKIDAEGNEPEVLKGSKNTLKKVEYVSIDFGDERGVNQDTTIIEVNDFLYENNFKLVEFSEYRLIGLYRNKSFMERN
jgi:FkbM family methyltransferase